MGTYMITDTRPGSSRPDGRWLFAVPTDDRRCYYVIERSGALFRGSSAGAGILLVPMNADAHGIPPRPLKKGGRVWNEIMAALADCAA